MSKVLSNNNGFATQKEVLPLPAKVRINVNIPGEVYSQLDETATTRGITMSEFVRNAIRVYYAILIELRQGKRIYVGENGRVEKELLVP